MSQTAGHIAYQNHEGVTVASGRPPHMKRSYQEYIVLALCVAGVLGISPFVFLRFLRSQWLVGTIDAVLVAGVILIGVYVWRTRQVRVPSVILTVFYLCGMVAVVYAQGMSLIYWAFPTTTAAYFLLRPKEAAVVNALALLALMPVMGMNLPFIQFLSVFVTLVLNNIFSYVFAKNMQAQQLQLAKQATRDSLTGAGNRMLFDENVKERIAVGKRNKEATALILLDIDHFKQINDSFGHVAGDEVLIKLTEILRARIRESDGLYRIGGEEFAIMLRGANSDAAMRLAEELRKLVETKLKTPGGAVTISLGVAECSFADSGKSWRERADSALYQAKEGGRNRTCLLR